jgi:hypothetical protein
MCSTFYCNVAVLKNTMAFIRKEKAMKLILPLGRSVVGVVGDVVAWLKETKRGEITSITLVAAPGDNLEVPPELSEIAPVTRVEVSSGGDFDIIPEKGMTVVVNGGTTIQQWAITKWWWQQLYDHGSAYQWESYRAPEGGSWKAVALNVQRDGVQILAHA